MKKIQKYDPEVYIQKSDVFYNGHWMNEIYFKEIEQDIRFDFRFPDFKTKKILKYQI